ncbi:BfmA/BtgA family mobilization protein [Flavivirga jejuensis]|uniref:BfmA/BtgA family mobilization protein n=1 Tax=Flavivirga jejuensis TaxID=870487 RepID=A0ABT8WU62_9FLAO|nr:BfmA/BtgA family mobilization protein [Flavivirga jejuensis]MDO5976703.1 BfmA/BtgA family mobilization protein [Flavivirga jejuensis]
MDDFKTVRIKKKTLLRFKRFSKKVSNSYSKTLDMVMRFFEWHGFLPSDRLGKSMVEEIIKNRINNAIAIIKDIEKSQTLPTMAMLQSLFEQSFEEDDDDFIEKKFENIEDEEDELLDKVKEVKTHFGKDYLKLELSKEEVEKYKRTIKNS